MFDKTVKFKGCWYYGAAGGLFGFVSLYTLMAMSVERYLIVSNPLRLISQRAKTGPLNQFIFFLFID